MLVARSKTCMTYAQFFDSVFELIDMWCVTAHESEYFEMATRLLRAVKRDVKTMDLREVDVEARSRGRPRSGRVTPTSDASDTERPVRLRSARSGSRDSVKSASSSASSSARK